MGVRRAGPRSGGGPLNRVSLLVLIVAFVVGAAIILLVDGPAMFVGIPIMITLGLVAGALQRVADQKRRRAERRAARKGARRS